MPADFTGLTTEISTLLDQVTATETVEKGAVALIDGFAAATTKAVTAALTADNAANQASITAATAAIEQERVRFAASGSLVGAAIMANTPAA